MMGILKWFGELGLVYLVFAIVIGLFWWLAELGVWAMLCPTALTVGVIVSVVVFFRREKELLESERQRRQEKQKREEGSRSTH